MRVLGVIDLLAGLAVRAREGNRAHYEPIRSAAGSTLPMGDAVALARVYLDELGVAELYVADLDAILSRLRDEPGHSAHGASDQVVAALADLGRPLWLDAGVSSVDQARAAATLGASRVVVGLETLRSFGALHEIAATIGGERVAFSLDLRDGLPMTSLLAEETGLQNTPGTIAARAVTAGASTVIVIDLARVGSGAGPDVELMAGIRRAVPHVPLLAGGGVRGLDDVLRLAEAGCDGALIATALQSGVLDKEGLAVARTVRQVSPTP